MRRFIILALIIVLMIGIAGVASSVALAKTGPILPGTSFFPIQYFSEQAYARFQGQSTEQVEFYFLLLERRIVNLVTQTGTAYEADSLDYLNKAIDQAILSWSNLPPDSAEPFRGKLISLLSASEMAVHRLEVAPSDNPNLVASLLAKLSTLRLLAADSLANPKILARFLDGEVLPMTEEKAVMQAEVPDATIDPLAVPFPAGSIARLHNFYPLVGRHTQIECQDCHSEGVYDGTPTYCEACHADMQPENHYVGDCGACHSAFSWRDVNFDHSVVNNSDCTSCHAVDKPANHYSNQCASCHSTTAWLPASFSHQAAGSTDCKSCHTADKPSNHFSGQCSACHSTNSWGGANFNHNGQTECQSCHSNDKPSNHFSGQCSACHSTNSWKGAGFNHNGQTDCQSCHSNDKPSNHFSGQCSACHSTNSWGGASFNHNGQTDCQSCHSKDKPSNHFSGQCSACHSTNSWEGAGFNHNGQTDCQSCHSGDKPSNHFSGQCSACHSTNSWGGASFSHNGQTDCKSCHSGDKPSNHFSGQCSACHSTNSWGGASFSHNGQTDCKSCHAADRPNEHDSGQCSQCHHTSDWDADDDDEGDDDDDDDDDEHGSMDLVPKVIFASTQIPLECGTCHNFSKVYSEKVQSSIIPAWWHELLILQRTMAPITIG